MSQNTEDPALSISVVIPLYNKEAHIARAIDSVLKQSLPCTEILVVDDGSTDGSARAAAEYGDAVKLIAQRNLGVSAARNVGISAATSEYVAFLDADDYWAVDHLETLSQLVVRYPHAKLYSTALYIYRDGKFLRPRSRYAPNEHEIVSNFFREYGMCLCLVHSSSVLVKREHLVRIGGFPVGVRRGEDIITWVRLALDGNLAHIERPTVVHDQSADNRSIAIRERQPPGALAYLGNLLKEASLTVEERKSIGFFYDRFALFFAAGFRLNGDSAAARQLVRLGIAHKRPVAALMTCFVICTPQMVLSIVRRLREGLSKSTGPVKM